MSAADFFLRVRNSDERVATSSISDWNWVEDWELRPSEARRIFNEAREQEWVRRSGLKIASHSIVRLARFATITCWNLLPPGAPRVPRVQLEGFELLI